jgi:hypothetical protein
MLTLADGTFFPPGCLCYSVGPRKRTCGSSPRSLTGAWVLLQGLFRSVVTVRGVCFSWPRRCFSRPRWRHTHVFDVCVRSVHIQEV